MQQTKQFIEDARKSGFVFDDSLPESILLRAKAWQAVGKTRGWKEDMSYEVSVCTGKNVCQSSSIPEHYCKYCYDCGSPMEIKTIERLEDVWLFKQHIFINHLADGDTIEEALKKISK